MLPNQAAELLKLLQLHANDSNQAAARMAHEVNLLRRTIALFLPAEARADYEALEAVFEAPIIEDVSVRLAKRAEIERALAEPKTPAGPPPANRAGRTPAPQANVNDVSRPPNRRFVQAAPPAPKNTNVGTDGGL